MVSPTTTGRDFVVDLSHEVAGQDGLLSGDFDGVWVVSVVGNGGCAVHSNSDDGSSLARGLDLGTGHVVPVDMNAPGGALSRGFRLGPGEGDSVE